MIDFKVEELSLGLIGEMLPHQDQYWREVTGPFHSFPPDVDWPTYMKAQELNRLRVIVGRVDAVLKAAAFIVIGPHPHSACISASLPLLYIDPEFRRGREGLRLVKMAEEVAATTGAQVLMTHGGVHNEVAKLFEYMNYSDYGRYFIKVIGSTEPVFKER